MGEKEQEVFISIYLDERRVKSNGKYPVKLRVFTPYPKRKQKLYKLPYDFEKKEFQAIWETKKPRKENKSIRTKLNALLVHADEIAQKIKPFNFEDFEKRYFNRQSNDIGTLKGYYLDKIEDFEKKRQINTAENYRCAYNSFQKFDSRESLKLADITANWLNEYEYVMTEQGRSLTTVSMYLRTLRTVINEAINKNELDPQLYPFERKGDKGKYKIPSSNKVKKALSKEQLNVLFNAVPETKEQQRAKDFWFFSYACNGINFKDIFNLKWKDYDGETITFLRAKTAKTKREQNKIVVYLDDFAINVIEKYGNENRSKDNYIFNQIDQTADPKENRRQLKNFIRLINQHFEKFARNNGINEKVTTYWARHSFATVAVNSNVSMETISEALGHSNLMTTANYIASIDADKKKKMNKAVMNFNN